MPQLSELDPLTLYLVIVNVATLALLALDHALCRRRDVDEVVSHTALSLLMFAGGALGGALAFALLDRRTNKRNSAWHTFSLVALVAWGLVVAVRYVAPFDAEALLEALRRDHRALLVYVGVASAAAFLLMVVDKLIAVRNGCGHDATRIPEAVLLVPALAGGSPGTLVAMLAARHKIRTPAFAVGVPLMLLVQLALVAYLMQLGIV